MCEVEQIVNHRRKEVFYDYENKKYISIFKPKFINKIKFFLRLRRYPGWNFKYISDELNKLGLKTPRILSVGKYRVETEEIKGESLKAYKDFEKYIKYWEKYIDCVALIINAGIYCGDFNYGNFFIVDEELYLLDLEDYRKTDFIGRGKEEAIRRLKKTVKDRWIFDKIIAKIK